MASVYAINKGVSAPIMFKGLKAQYIWYLGGVLAGVLLLFAILYICEVNMFICLGIAAMSGGGLFYWVYGMSNQYGEHGLSKKIGKRKVPDLVRSKNRWLFIKGL